MLWKVFKHFETTNLTDNCSKNTWATSVAHRSKWKLLYNYALWQEFVWKSYCKQDTCKGSVKTRCSGNAARGIQTLLSNSQGKNHMDLPKLPEGDFIQMKIRFWTSPSISHELNLFPTNRISKFCSILQKIPTSNTSYMPRECKISWGHV